MTLAPFRIPVLRWNICAGMLGRPALGEVSHLSVGLVMQKVRTLTFPHQVLGANTTLFARYHSTATHT